VFHSLSESEESEEESEEVKEEEEEVEYSERSEEDEEEGEGGLLPSINALRLRFMLILTPAFLSWITIIRRKRGKKERGSTNGKEEGLWGRKVEWNIREVRGGRGWLANPCLRDFFSLGMPAIFADSYEALDGYEVHPNTLIF
jgi:hypothetical protein